MADAHESIKTLMLTTVDNPFNPSTEWEDWLKFDEQHRYFTNDFLARIAITSTDMSPVDYKMAVNDAILQIIENPFFSGMYRAVIVEDRGEG